MRISQGMSYLAKNVKGSTRASLRSLRGRRSIAALGSVLFKGLDRVRQLGEVSFLGEPLLQTKSNRGLAQRQVGLGDDEVDAALAQPGHENAQLFRRRHVDLRNGPGIEDHLANGHVFVGQEMFQAL